MKFVAGSPIQPGPARSIRDRQEIFEAKDGSLRQTYIQYQSLIPWVRMTSTVKIKEKNADGTPTPTSLRFNSAGYDLAKNNVLFTLFNKETDGLQGYEKTQLGYRPAPGITNMNIRSHNRFGSLRTAEVRYQCWSKEQLDILELLYMRPGYTIFLEWGWSGYLTDDKEVDNLQQHIDFFQYTKRQQGIDAILEKKQKNRYHYDGIAGFVKNFTWSLRADGGYDCSTYIVTSGDIAESLKVNVFLSQEYIDKRVNSLVDQINETRRLTYADGYEGDKSVDVFTGFDIKYPTQDQMLRDEFIPSWSTNIPDTADGNALRVFVDEIRSQVLEVLGSHEKFSITVSTRQQSALRSETDGYQQAFTETGAEFFNPQTKMFAVVEIGDEKALKELINDSRVELVARARQPDEVIFQRPIVVLRLTQ